MGRLLLIGLFLTLAACQKGWDKDPFAKEQDNIKNAIKPNEEPPVIPPPKSNTLFVEMDQVFSVVEGETLEIPVRYHIAHPEVVLSSIQVQGLEEKFPGSTFDAEKNIIRITPPFDFVPVDTPYIVQPISISFFNSYQGQVEEVKRTVVINVLPQNTSVPIIKDVDFPSGSVVLLGKEKEMIITVEDTDKEFSPRLSAVNAFGTGLQGAQFITIPAEGVYNETDKVWEFTAKINVPANYYLPSTSTSVTVDLFAYSITGIPSRSMAVRFSLNSSTAEPPKIVSEDRIIFYEKTENQYTFSAFDIRGSGQVTASCANAPTGMSCDCRRDTFPNSGIHYCTVTWMPETTGIHPMSFKADNRVSSSSSNTTKAILIDVRSAQ